MMLYHLNIYYIWLYLAYSGVCKFLYFVVSFVLGCYLYTYWKSCEVLNPTKINGLEAIIVLLVHPPLQWRSRQDRIIASFKKISGSFSLMDIMVF